MQDKTDVDADRLESFGSREGEKSLRRTTSKKEKKRKKREKRTQTRKKMEKRKRDKTKEKWKGQ